MVVVNSRTFRLAKMKAMVARQRGFRATAYKKKGKGFGTSITRKK